MHAFKEADQEKDSFILVAGDSDYLPAVDSLIEVRLQNRCRILGPRIARITTRTAQIFARMNAGL